MPTHDEPSLVDAIYARRFRGREQRRHEVWRILCGHFFQRWIPPSSRVLDLGGGYGEFICNITAAKKWVVDINPAARDLLPGNVEPLIGTLDKFEAQLAGRVDTIFCSNFLEHLPTKEVLVETVRCCRRILVPGGRLILMGPNIRFMSREYWDRLDHHLPLSDVTVAELLGVVGMRVLYRQARFLPAKFDGKVPSHPFLAAIYLYCPPAQWLMGRQFLFLAENPGSA